MSADADQTSNYDEGDQLQQDKEIGGDDDYEFDFDAWTCFS